MIIGDFSPPEMAADFIQVIDDLAMLRRSQCLEILPQAGQFRVGQCKRNLCLCCDIRKYALGCGHLRIKKEAIPIGLRPSCSDSSGQQPQQPA